MEHSSGFEDALHEAFGAMVGPFTPGRLRAAMHHALFPSGSRFRPRLLLQTAAACGATDLRLATAAAVTVELLHCASLVHDDLPCFDDAVMRRGRPSVHAAFGEALAVLTGDALIVASFETLGRGSRHAPEQLAQLVACFASGVGAARGLVAGQAREAEACTDLREYHRTKTGALFEACVCAGAIAAGFAPDRWTAFGRRLGEAYQVADDIGDLAGSARALGKPAGRDALLDRPNAVLQLGMAGARERLAALVEELGDDVPACPGREAFVTWLERACSRLAAIAEAPLEDLDRHFPPLSA